MANIPAPQPARTVTAQTTDPMFHAANIERMLDDVTRHIRDDIERMDRDPRAQALFETSAEVLQGLRKAYHDYQAGTEKAWK